MIRRDKQVHEGEMRPKLLGAQGGGLAINPTTGSVGYQQGQIGGPNIYNPIGPDDYSEQKISDCKVIGHQEFFPGGGKIDIRNLSTAQVMQRLII